MEGPPLGPGGEDITWPDQVAPRGQKASSTRKIKPQTSNLNRVWVGWKSVPYPYYRSACWHDSHKHQQWSAFRTSVQSRLD